MTAVAATLEVRGGIELWAVSRRERVAKGDKWEPAAEIAFVGELFKAT